MPRFIGLLTGVLLLIVPAGAQAATVSVQAEDGGPTAVLWAQSTTAAGLISGNGGANSCVGADRPIGALQAATSGNWSGEWFSFGDFQVGRILGSDLTTASTAPYYWSLNVNEAPASSGICSQPVADGDRVLFYKACNTALTGCYSGTVLRVTGPASVQPGAAQFHVEQAVTTFGPAPDFTPTTTRTPAVGATLQAGSAGATTDASGNATLSLPAGPYTVRATRSNDVPSQMPVCATTGSGNACITTVLPVLKPGKPEVDSPKDRKSYRGKGPRALKGSFSGDSVKLRLTARPSTRSGRCTTFDSKRLKFVRQKTCGATRGKSFSVDVEGGNWSYLLPKAPGRGRYVLDAYGTDSAGKIVLERVTFFVK